MRRRQNAPQNSRSSLLLLAVLLALCFLIACQRKKQPEAAVDAPYTQTPNTVELDLLPVASSPGTRRWAVSYTGNSGGITRFDIEFPEAGSLDPSTQPTGKLFPETGSDPSPLLDALGAMLHTRRTPTHTQQVESLPLDYNVLGMNQSRAADGSFSNDSKGNWTTFTLSLANGQCEIGFNLNPVIHKAEFSAKNAKNPNKLLSELARIL